MTKDERNDVIEDIFGVYGLVSANDTVDFNMKSDNLCNTHPVFSDWYNKHLKKNRLLQHVNRPSWNNSRLTLWTNNNCEIMNHRFKLETDWKPQHLPELINTIHGIVKVDFADLQRALYGMGNFELHEHFKRHYMQYYLYGSKTSDEKGQLFNRLLAIEIFALNFTKFDTTITTKDLFLLLKWRSYNILMSDTHHVTHIVNMCWTHLYTNKYK
jgi:hypothetical protein